MVRLLTHRSWLVAAVLVVLTGGAAQSAQAQSDQPSVPQQGAATSQETTQVPSVAPMVQQAVTEEEAPALPMIGGIVLVGLNVEASRLFGPLGSTFIPPDTTCAVGPNHIVEFINGNFEVLDKTTGASIENRTLLNFWVTKVGVPAPNNNNIFDPKIIFDPSSGRWFATAEDATIDADNNGVNEVSNNFYIARTETNDPTGDWDFVVVVADSVALSSSTIIHSWDLMPMGSTSARRISAAEATSRAIPFQSRISARRTDRCESDPFRSDARRARGSCRQLATSRKSGAFEWSSASAGFHRDGAPAHGHFGATAGGATLGAAVAIGGDPGHAAPPAARQPDDSDAGDGLETIENVAPRLVANPVVIGTRMWAVHAVQGNAANSAVRWYEIDEAANTIVQTGLIDNPAIDFHEPSIAVNQFGHVVIGYTCSGPNLAASVCVSVGTTAVVSRRFSRRLSVRRLRTDIVICGTPTMANPCAVTQSMGRLQRDCARSHRSRYILGVSGIHRPGRGKCRCRSG